MTSRLAAAAIAIALMISLSACPADSLVGTWQYYDVDGTLVATVTFASDGTMTYESADGDGTGVWNATEDDVTFTAMVNFSVSATLQFDGTVIKSDVIAGTTTSDQPPTERHVVMVR